MQFHVTTESYFAIIFKTRFQMGFDCNVNSFDVIYTLYFMTLYVILYDVIRYTLWRYMVYVDVIYRWVSFLLQLLPEVDLGEIGTTREDECCRKEGAFLS